MARLTLSKSAMQQQRQNLVMYQRFLPSLDLKRRQLMAEQARAGEALAKAEAEVAQLSGDVGREIPMLANEAIDLTGLVSLERVDLGEENVVGVRLPILKKVDARVYDYSLLAKPPWVDAVAASLQRVLELNLQIQVLTERVRRLDYAIRRTTQRVNLFDKVLIPAANRHIQKIRVFLADTERAAVVRSKIAKGRHGNPPEPLEAAEEAI